MTYDREKRIVHRRQHPSGHLLLTHVEAAVDRGNDKIEPLQHPLVIVDPTVLEDIGFDAFQDPEPFQPRVDFVYLVGLAG